jgi:hypothetical protein
MFFKIKIYREVLSLKRQVTSFDQRGSQTIARNCLPETGL